MPSPLDPQKAADYGTWLGGIAAFITAIGAMIAWPFRTFETKRAAEAKYLKIVNPDGTRGYVHPSEWEPMKKMMEDNLEESRKWRAMAKDWMEHP